MCQDARWPKAPKRATRSCPQISGKPKGTIAIVFDAD
jgi:hypothetical protein